MKPNPDPLSLGSRRQILRRLRDMDDAARSPIPSRPFEGRHLRLYEVSDDATLFMCRPSAAISRLLGAGTRIINVAGKRGKRGKVKPN